MVYIKPHASNLILLMTKIKIWVSVQKVTTHPPNIGKQLILSTACHWSLIYLYFSTFFAAFSKPWNRVCRLFRWSKSWCLSMIGDGCSCPADGCSNFDMKRTFQHFFDFRTKGVKQRVVTLRTFLDWLKDKKSHL